MRAKRRHKNSVFYFIVCFFLDYFPFIEEIEANPGEIQQVFTNLITNAFQAMNDKRGVLTLSTRSLKDSVGVGVSDNGMGISQEYPNKIFDPFFTTKNSGEGTRPRLKYRLSPRYEVCRNGGCRK